MKKLWPTAKVVLFGASCLFGIIYSSSAIWLAFSILFVALPLMGLLLLAVGFHLSNWIRYGHPFAREYGDEPSRHNIGP